MKSLAIWPHFFRDISIPDTELLIATIAPPYARWKPINSPLGGFV